MSLTVICKDIFLLIASLLDTSTLYSLSCTSKFYKSMIHRNIKYFKCLFVSYPSYTDYIDSLFSNKCNTILGHIIVDGHINLFRWHISDDHDFAQSGELGYVKMAVAHGSLEILKNMRISSLDTMNFVEKAAENGHLDVLLWLHKKNCGFRLGRCALEKAAEGGHLNILKWVSLVMPDTFHTYYKGMYYGAALNGHLEIIKWMWSLMLSFKIELEKRFIHENAISGGHLHILKWLYEEFDYRVDSISCPRYISSNHINVFKWLKEYGCVIKWNDFVAINVFNRQKYDLLKWIIDNGCLWNDDITNNALKTGNIIELQWLLDNGFYYHNQTYCIDAVKNRQYDLLKWLVQNSCQWDHNVYCELISTERTNMLEWLYNSSPMGKTNLNLEVSLTAAKYGNLNVLKWIRSKFNFELNAKECPFDESVCMVAVTYRYFEIFEWLLENGCECSQKTHDFCIKMRDV